MWTPLIGTRWNYSSPVNFEQIYLHWNIKQIASRVVQADLLDWSWFTYQKIGRVIARALTNYGLEVGRGQFLSSRMLVLPVNWDHF